MAGGPLGMKAEALDAAGPAFREFITELANEDLGFIVKTHAKINNISEEVADLHKDAFLKFMALAKLTGRSLSPDKDSDAFWHTFLTHTRDYAAFSERHFGTFVHHEPIARDEPREGPPIETAELLWEAFEVRADCNNTCDADWAIPAFRNI